MSPLKRSFSKKKDSEQSTENMFKYNRSNYEKSYSVPRKILRWLGIRMTHKISDFTGRCWEKFYWFELGNLVLAASLEMLSMVETARRQSFEDTIAIFRMLPCFGYTLLGIAKSFKIVFYRSVYENLVNELGDMWPDGEVTQEDHNIISLSLKHINFINKGYYWCNNVLLITFLSPPFIESLKRAAGYNGKMLLHFFYWLPFDPFQPIYVDILLLAQTWHALVVIWSNICGDLLFCTFLSHITTQFDLLSVRIQRLIYVPIDKQLIRSYPLSAYSKDHVNNESQIEVLSGDKWENKHQKELSAIIKRHQDLIRLSGDVENMFSFSLLVNFINSSIIICLCGFCCVLVEKWNELAYKSFLMTALCQTWLLCWYGQKLMDSSKGIAHALYNSGWYRSSKRIRSSILIMIHRAQTGVYITTYGFSIISLKSYTQIIKSSWSYFTLLLNIYKE